MKNRKLRNIGIIAHIDAGKTTTSERILFQSGRIHRMGEVHDGDTFMDWREDEQARGITIAAAASTIYWHDAEINLIDTPGHVDFTAEVERSMRVIDGALVVICAVNGVEAQSETVWRQADSYAVPRMVFVNKLDRPGADFERAVDSLRTRLGAPVVPIQIPCFDENEAPIGAIDLITMEKIVFPDETSCERIAPSPAELEAAQAEREHMIEFLADNDDELAEIYLGGGEIPVDQLRAAVRRATLANHIVPVLCGASLKNIGVQPVLDAIVDYLPAPEDLPDVKGINPKTHAPLTRRHAADEPFAGLVFKVQAQTGGELFYVRIYSGKLKVGDAPINPRTGKRERIHDLLRMHAKSGERVAEVVAGDIVAVPGLKHSSTGDTLHDQSAPIAFESITFPEPVVSIAVEPKTTAARDKLNEALAKMSREDPTFTITEDDDTGQMILSGMGELHLEIITNRLQSEFHVEANVGKPRVAYRERIAAAAEVEHEAQRTLGGKTLYGRIRLKVEPTDPEQSGKADWAVADDLELPKGMKEGLIEHLRGELSGSGSYGYAVHETRATLLEVGIKDVDPAGAGLTYALTEAFDKALEKVGTQILEPIMRLEIASPQEYVGNIHRTLQSKRAVIERMDESGGISVIRGTVPMSEMFGFSNHVRTISAGRASFSMEPAGYAAVPDDVTRKMFGE